MKLRLSALIFSLCALALTSCGPTTDLVGSSRAENTTGLTFRNLLVATVAKDPWRRNMFEQAMKTEITGKGLQAVGSMEIMPLEEQLTKDNIQKAIQDRGIDGVIVMRLVEVDKSQNKVYDRAVLYGSGNAYGSFYGYYAYALATINTPGYVLSDKVVRIETSLFDVKDGRMVWNGLSDTANPSKFSEITKPLSTIVVRELGVQGFVPR
jgi:hypothetical protein